MQLLVAPPVFLSPRRLAILADTSGSEARDGTPRIDAAPADSDSFRPNTYSRPMSLSWEKRRNSTLPRVDAALS